MEYRKLPHGSEKISVIGLPTGGEMFNMSHDEIVTACNYAFDNGVNFVDFISHRNGVEKAAAEAIKPRRKDIYLQTHFGIDYPNDQYTKVRDVDFVKRFIERDMKLLDTDYLDFGLIANVDSMDDLDRIMKKGGIWDYMQKLKGENMLRHYAFSSHDVKMCNHLIDMGVFDLFMLSENIAEDFDVSDGGLNLNSDRHKLFVRCAKEGVAISTMKTFLGGKLLDEKTSPLGVKLSVHQCISYNLDRPAIISCLPGCGSIKQLKETLRYFDLSDEEKDYSVVVGLKMNDMKNSCIYCDHCQPCTAEIDIAQVNKFKDLAEIGDSDAVDHYRTMKNHASDCVDCGLCDDRCPFGASPSQKIKEAQQYFGY